MELISIGEAAERLSMNASALRYYEERGLVRPAERRNGRRMYGRTELRRLAFVHLAHQLGLPLATVAAIMDAPSESWRTAVRDQIAELDALIARADGARRLLTHALGCPRQHPVVECPTMMGTLDDLLDGRAMDDIAAEHR